jgi:GDP-L-fucose synthase
MRKISRVLVAGGSGFVGTNLLKFIAKEKRYRLFSTYFKNKNFIRYKNVRYIRANLEDFKRCKEITKNIDLVFMCAANSSGAKIMENSPLDHFNGNIRMNINMLQASFCNKVSKFVFISSNTVYPVSTKKVDEKSVTNNFFEKYYIVAWMKRFSEIACGIYSEKLNKMMTIIIRPGNLYGPYDKFAKSKSKVIPSLIVKVLSKSKILNVWGDGRDIKDFLYIDDFIKGLMKVVKKNKKIYEVVNIASGKSISINKIIRMILKITNLKKKIKYNMSMPTMIPLRLIDVKKVNKKYGFRAKISLAKGLKKTLDWYRGNQKLNLGY